MHLGSRVPESDLASSTPKARLFQALKQKTCAGESFRSLLNMSGMHSVLAWSDGNQPQEEGDEESPQSAFEMSPPALQPTASPEDCGGTKRMPKALLFDRLKQVPSALPPVRVADQLSDLQAAKAVSQSADSSDMFAGSSIRSAAKQTEATKTVSDTAMPLLSCLNPVQKAEFVKNTKEKCTVEHKGSKLKFYAKNPVVKLSRICQNKQYSFINCNKSAVASDHSTKDQYSTCSPSESGDSQQVLGNSEDFSAPAWTSLVPASFSLVEALDETNNNREMPFCSSGISLQNLLPSAEFLVPQNLTYEQESAFAGDHLFNRKTVHCAAPLAVDGEVCSSGEDVQTRSSIDEMFESRSTSMKRTSNNNQSGKHTDGSNDQILSKPKQSSKRLRKQESLLLSSKGDAAVIVENHLSSTANELEREHQDVVVLDKWTLRLLADQCLCLTGYRKDEPGGRLHCSDAVTRCLRRDEVQTVSGTLYHLSGRLCKSTATEAGLPKRFLHNFLDGFPPNWEDLLNKALKKLSSRRSHGNLSCVRKILEEAKPLSGSVEDDRGSSEPVQKVKKAAAQNASIVAKILSNKGSKNDPLSLRDLPVGRRSGRLVIPPLAWWANQRVIVDPTSKQTIIAQENENVLGLPAVHFKSEKEIPAAELGEKLEVVKASSEEQHGRPQKSTVPKMKEMEVKSSRLDKDKQETRPEDERQKDGSVSVDSVTGSRLQPTSRQKNPDEASVRGSCNGRGSYRKREMLAKTCRSCSTSSVDTTIHGAKKRRRLDLKNYKDNQSGDFFSKNCPQSSQLPQQTLHRANNHSRKRLSINQKAYITADSADNTSGLSRSQRNCDVKSDRNVSEVRVRRGRKPRRTLTLHNSQVMQNSEKEPKQNSALWSHEEFLNRTENQRTVHESRGNEEAWGGSNNPHSHKTIPRDNSGEKAEQKNRWRRRSTEVRSASHRYKEDYNKLSSLSQKSSVSSSSNEGRSARSKSSRKRMKKHRIEDLKSGEPLELVYTKSDHMQKTIVTRHDSRKRRECDMKNQPSFLIESPLLMQDLPPKPRPSRFQASGNLSDSDDSANVEYFFSSDESET